MSEIPESWVECKLGDVTEYGATEKIEPEAIPDDAWILELEDIEKDTSRLLQRMTFSDRKSKSTKNRFRRGDVLYGKLRPYLNKVIRAPEDGFATTEIIPIPSSDWLDGSYLFYWLKHPAFTEYVSGVSHGLNMPRLGTDAGKKAPFVLAPIAEQKRIADKLNRLLSRVDSCREQLDRMPAILNRFRQSVLTAALNGTLTKEWRESKGTEYDWRTQKANDVCTRVQSGTTPKSDEFRSETGIPFLKVYNIVDQRVDFSYRSQFVDEDVFRNRMQRASVLPNDVLMNIVGPPLGKVAIVPESFPEWAINQAIAMFRVGPALNPRFLYYQLCSGLPYSQLLLETRGSAGQSNISLTQCREMLLSVPSLSEQSEIVRRIEVLFAFVDRLEACLADSRGKVEGLSLAILAKAFRGKLVPQNPDDEPASVLLARIHDRKQTLEAEKQTRKPKITGPKRMKKITPESLSEYILELPETSFSFDELRQKLSGNYEDIKNAVFKLLEKNEIGFTQYFDEKAKEIRFTRAGK